MNSASPPDPLRVLVDACVFPRLHDWLRPLLEFGRQGDIVPLWSPLIIAESHRVWTWLWAKRHGGTLSDAAKRQCSEAAHRLFAEITPYFRVVDDHPPYDPLWTPTPPDQWDVPLWQAAVIGNAHFVVTANLRDGPPPNRDGLRLHRNIVCTPPDEFLDFLVFYADLKSVIDLGRRELTTPPPPTPQDPNPLAPSVAAYLAYVQRQLPDLPPDR